MALLNVNSGALKDCSFQRRRAFFYSSSISSPTSISLGSSSSSSSSAPLRLRHREHHSETILDVQMLLCPSKRRLCVSILALMLASPSRSSQRAISQDLELERYTDSNEGFTLLRPSSYIKVEKSGATVLFEELNRGSNTVGVVVNPVRLSNLKEFGSPQVVADKIIQAEKRKESTKDAEVIVAGERSGLGGLQVYEFEYKVDSTRGGMQRVFSAAFVTSKKLYLLNIAHSDKPESPLDTHTRMKLEQVLHSFDVPSLT